MEATLIMAAVSIVAGLVVGVFSGMLGIGGGTILVPIFRLAYGLDAIAATATSLFTIIPTSVAGAITHIRNKTCVPAVGVAAGLGGACTSSLGVYLASVSPAWAIMAAAAAVICYSAFTMLKKAIALKPTSDQGKGEAAKKAGGDIPAVEITLPLIAKAAGIGLCAGVISGYVGVGGGFIMMPLFLSVLNLPMKRSSGTSLIAVILLAIPATIMQFTMGNVDVMVGLAIVAGSIPGAMLGARLQQHVPERLLRFIFAGFLVVAAVLLIVRELGLLG